MIIQIRKRIKGDSMTNEMIVGILSLIGTLAGTFGGIVTANKLTQYRIDKIEERLDNMDALDARISKLEIMTALQDTYISTLRSETERIIKNIKEIHHDKPYLG